MIVIIGNIKGGVGKSTLTLALANYLTQEHRKWLTVLDLDFKESLVSVEQNSKILETTPLYNIITIHQAQQPSVVQEIKNNPQKILLIDLPSNLSDNSLIEYINAADLFLCPFSYDRFTIPATLLFSLIVSNINTRSPICFLPNRLKKNVSIETRPEIEKALSNFGTITPPIYDKIDFQHISNIHTPTSLLSLIMPVFDSVYDQFFYK